MEKNVNQINVEKLRKLLKAKKISIYRMSNELGKSPSYYYFILNGKRRMSIDAFNTIVEYYNIDINKIIE